MKSKKCSQCEIDKSIDLFSPNGDRLRSNCKECQAKKRYQHVSLNKEKVLEQCRESNKRNRDKILAKKKVYHLENKEEILYKHKEYYIKNKELILLKVEEYRKKYPEVYRASNAKRRAATNGAVCTVSSNDIKSLKEHYLYCCAYCGCETNKDNPLHIDHMIPLSKGGQHVIDNLLPACRSCNSKKFTMGWDEWCNKIGFTIWKE